MENAEKLSQEEMANIKKDLLERKKQILSDLSNISREDSHETDHRSAKFPEYGDKPDENAQEISQYSTDLVTEKVLEKTLRDIEVALTRIEDGSYETCKYCAGPIGKKRLIARPVASACITCKTNLQNS